MTGREAMDPARWERIQAAFHAVVAAGPTDRARILDEQCGDDPGVRGEVQALLNAGEGADRFLDALARRAGLHAAQAGAGPSLAGRRFGTYRLIRRVGQGGMGIVYLAERDDRQFEKRVAVKLLPLGLGGDVARQRFLAERRILAGLEHPGIARLLDAGITDDGTPFFVMEYVEGEAIDVYCEARRLSIAARVELFLQVCEAVEHAHRNLVVHRDLKPANVLVTPEGRVKLLDFGIAKVLDSEATGEATALTHVAGRPMTPAYASPEQVRGEPVTTATDVYALGVLLYELLAGRPPYEVQGLTPSELERLVCTQDPLPPSTAVLQGDATGRVGSGRTPPARSDGAARRAKRLRGDLDTIVLKALRKEPEARYGSVAAFAEDLARNREGQPVAARAATPLYRARKLVRRQPALVAGAVAALLAVGGYLVTVTGYANRLEAERDRARVEASTAEALSSFLMDLFGANDPDSAGGDAPTALDLLERGEARAAALDGQPAIQARMLDVMGQIYTNLGQYARAEPLFRESLEIRRTLHTAPHADVAGTLDRLGDVLLKMDKLDLAEPVLLEAIEVARLAGAPAVEADSHNDLGHVLHARGDYAGAEAAHRRALALRRDALGERHHRTGTSLHNIALALESQERFEEAETYFREALAIGREALGAEHSSVTLTLTTLGRLYDKMGREELAEPLLREALETNRRRLGPTHPRLALDLNDLAALLARRGDMAAAEPLFREALAIREAALGEDHSDIAISLNNLAHVLAAQERYHEALPLNQRALRIATARLGDGHLNTALFTHNAATAYQRVGRLEEAERHFRDAIERMRRALPEAHPLAARPLAALGTMLLDAGRTSEAEPLLRSALELRRADDDHEAVAETLESLARAAANRGDSPEAATHLREALELRIQVLGEDDPSVALTRLQLEDVDGRAR